jgi:purine-binding chemotaxis protein CheW
MIDLHATFGFKIVESFTGMNNLVVRYKDEDIGLLVDSVLDVVTAEEKDISEPPANIDGVTGSFFEGVYKLEDELVAILDISEIVKI